VSESNKNLEAYSTDVKYNTTNLAARYYTTRFLIILYGKDVSK